MQNSKLSRSSKKSRMSSGSSSSSQPLGPSQDSQLIPPGQQVRADPTAHSLSQVRESVPRAVIATVADELLVIERQTVAVAILQEKRVKLQGMVEGSREIPRELKAVRNLPGLGPSYKFSAEVRFKAEELCKEQDRAYVSMLLEDLSGKVIPDALKDMEDLLASCRRRIARKVDQADYDAAEMLFNEDSAALLERQDELLAAKRQPKKRKATSQQQQRPSKRPRKDYSHSKRQERPKHSKKQ